MWYVYILKSLAKNFLYVGSTNNIERRLKEHNSGEVKSTKPYLPLKLAAYIAVENEMKARKLEKYFKTGSGKAVLKKRILTYEALAK
ncbi:MAG: GIY-YIG nuclease family protein [Ignavibacteria bacterium]|jgi:putative endonuclease